MKNNNTLKLLFTLFGTLFLLIAPLLGVQAQELPLVKGKILGSDGEPLPGVTIIIKEGDAGRGTMTNIDGEFSIKAKSDETLVMSFIGYTTKEEVIGSRTFLSVTLEEDMQQLDEVVVVGYGTQKKSHLTGAIAKVKNESLDQIPLARVDDALAGQVSGVNIQMTNPEAGGAPVIRVRGVGSITGDASPLVVVDGVVTDGGLGNIDMNDVESIEVLKDAASSAIYGSRASNGVILVSTKTGHEGKVKFTYNGYVGFKSVPENDVLKSVGEWKSYVESQNGGEIPENMINRFQSMERFGETDWQAEMMDGGIIHSHSLAARGGTAKTKYSASASYLNDESVLLTDNYKKLNVRLNLDTKINDRFSVGLKVNPSYSIQRRFPIGVHDAIRQSPWLPGYVTEDNIDYVNTLRENGRWEDAKIGDYTYERMFDDYDLADGIHLDGSSSDQKYGTDISTTSNANPYAKVLERQKMVYRTRVLASTYLKAKLAKGLQWKSSVSADMGINQDEEYRGINSSRNGANGTYGRDRRRVNNHMITDHLLTYNRTIGGHDINAVAGFSYEYWHSTSSEAQAVGYVNDYITTLPISNISEASSYASEMALVSYFGRVNYAYNDKYLVSLSFRSDGSSRFGVNNQFGIFPAASVGWRISEEDFLKGNDFISTLKLRVSYGMTGNSGSGNIDRRYPHIGLVSPVGAVLDGGTVNGFNQITLANPDLRWEKSEEINPGLDIGLWHDKLTLSVDAYQKTSKDLLLLRPISSTTGFQEAEVNLGQVRNSGIEFELGATPLHIRDFRWSLNGNISFNKNELLDMAGADGLITTVDSKRPAEWIAKEGRSIVSFYGYVMEKEIPAENLKNPWFPINGQSQDVYVKDLNGDGLIDSDDRTYLGSPFPTTLWAITNTLTYKNFDLSFMFQGSHGAKVRNIDPQYINNQFSSNQDYITDVNNENFFEDADRVQQRIFTDDIVMDASYIALRNFNLGYTLPTNLVSKVGVSKLRVYLAAQNLLYIMGDSYRGFNPEGVTDTGNPLTYGYQRGVAPLYRTVSLGCNLQF